MTEQTLVPQLLAILKSLLTQAPLILVALAGVLLALRRWPRSTAARRFALPGFGLLLVNAMFFSCVWAVLPQWLSEQGWSGRQLEAVFTLVAVSTNAIEAIGIACLVVALYLGAAVEPR
ncbi:MAG: hypothetical protein JNG90_10345 [Planctomycetaceae bacterium]|nr:hypothetical protein [Planctomycetaceae bacterium]